MKHTGSDPYQRYLKDPSNKIHALLEADLVTEPFRDD